MSYVHLIIAEDKQYKEANFPEKHPSARIKIVSNCTVARDQHGIFIKRHNRLNWRLEDLLR